MEVKAKLRYLRISPRKVRRVADLIRNYNAEEAKLQLRNLTLRSARPLMKLIDSAISNAKHNLGLDTTNLYIKKLTIDEARILKRHRARAFGRAAQINKRSSHVNLVLDEGKASSITIPKTVQKELKPEEPMNQNLGDKDDKDNKDLQKNKIKKSVSKPKLSLKNRLTHATRRVFQRKAID